MMTHGHETLRHQRHAIAARLDALGWGAFFIWLGIAFIADVGLGVGLLGIGTITLAGQVARRSFSLPMRGFWLVSGSLFVVAGVWDLLRIGLPLVPVLLVLAGLAVIGTGFARRPPAPGRAA